MRYTQHDQTRRIESNLLDDGIDRYIVGAFAKALMPVNKQCPGSDLLQPD
jgi:hypothetical protein